MARTRFVNVRPASDFGNTAKAVSISGFDQIIKNLNMEILAMTGGAKEGLLNVAKHIRREMETTPPLVPIDLGNLDGSWETHQITEGKKHGLLMGFSANYALWVHEMVGADFTSPRLRYGPGIGKARWYIPRPGAGAKFLESAINRNHDTILQIIADKMKV